MLKAIPKYWWPFFILFVIHQVVEKIFNLHFSPADNYLDPLLTFPILLGIYLAQKRIALRLGNEHYLSIFEIAVIGIFFSLVFELGLPKYFKGFYYDPWDFLAYAFGIIIFIFLQKK